jgi:hypothetical protein
MVNGGRHGSRFWHRLAAVVVFLNLVPLADVARAGQADASIYGLVTDESGAVLPGVTVTVSSPALQVRTISAVTAADGEYRLPSLPIGLYQVEYALQGFQTVRREEIRLTVGFAARLDVRMHVGNLEETVTVTAASPIVDVTQTSHSTTLTREVLELTPTGRAGLTTLLAQVPGTRALLDVGGSSFNTDVSVSSFGQPGEPQSATSWTFGPKKRLTSGAGRRVITRANLFNALNGSTVTSLNTRSGASFLRPSAIIRPRIADLSASFSF